MSYSNPMHHEEGKRAPIRKPWPFPVQPLQYPSLPPQSKPVKEPPPPLPDEEAPF